MAGAHPKLKSMAPSIQRRNLLGDFKTYLLGATRFSCVTYVNYMPVALARLAWTLARDARAVHRLRRFARVRRGPAREPRCAPRPKARCQTCVRVRSAISNLRQA